MGEVVSAEDEETQISNNIGPRITLWETREATWDCVVPRRMENQEGILLQRVGKFMAFYAHVSSYLAQWDTGVNLPYREGLFPWDGNKSGPCA